MLFSRRTLVLASALFCSAASAGCAPLQLKYVAIITRHGVRSPIWDQARLNQFSVEPWPDWGVAPGQLTPHGRHLITLIGAYYREWLSGEGLLERSGCDSAQRVHIRADTDRRTIETGSELAKSMAPGCTITVHYRSSGTDPLFNPAKTDSQKPDMAAAVKAVRVRLNARPPRTSFDSLQYVLTGGTGVPEHPLAWQDDIGVRVNGAFLELTGSLAAASTLAENLLLEYANGWSGSKLGWGRLNVESVRRILELNAGYADLMRRTPYLARAYGSNLVAHILDSMEQAVTGRAVQGALGSPGDTVLIVSGHDTNIANISGIMGISWNLPGYPANETPPGGALIFELWQDASSAYFVTLRYAAQTLEQMHDAAPLTLASPPAIADIRLPGCAPEEKSGACPWPVFERTVKAAVDPQFVAADEPAK